MKMDSEKESSIKVLLFPFLAHGHVSPCLELANRLSHRNFHLYICSTPANLSSINSRFNEIHSHKIDLVELHLPSLPDLPPHYHTSNGLPLHLNHLLGEALKLGKLNFTEILKKLRPDLLIHDLLLPWAAPIASGFNIPTATFFTSGAAVGSYFCHLFRNPGTEYPFPALSLSEFEFSIVMNLLKRHNEKKDELPPDDEGTLEIKGAVLINSSDEIEGKYVDYLAKLMDWNIFPVGSLVQELKPVGGGRDGDAELLEWLGKKDVFSTVFVSFGSEYFLDKENIEEIAHGLEMSNVNFIWVIRFPKGDETKVHEVIPDGFLERIGERGRILNKWAPQAKILRHTSIGGFVSHCGWNSILESIDFGVPIIAMPMHLDQPLNAKFAVELGVAMEVKRDLNGKFQREDISQVVKDVVLEKRGKDLRCKIKVHREKIRSRSEDEMDVVVQKLKDICGKSKVA